MLQIPFLQLLAKEYPEAEIILFTSNPLSKLFQGLNLVHEVFEFDGYGEVWARLRKLNPDLIFSFRYHSALLNLMIGLQRKAIRVGFGSTVTHALFDHCIEKDPTRYRALHYLEFLEVLDVKVSEFHTTFRALSSADIEQKPADEKWVFMMPGAGRDFKLWGLENFFELVKRLHARCDRFRFRFVLGPGEDALKQEIESSGNPLFAVEFSRPIPDLIGLLNQADLVVAHDCGPSHISHLCAAPHLGLISDEFHDAGVVIEEWFHIRDNARTLVGAPGEAITGLSVDEVEAQVLEMLVL